MRTVKVLFIVMAMVCLSGSLTAQNTLIFEGFEGPGYGFTSVGTANWAISNKLSASGLYSDSVRIANPGDTAVLVSQSFPTTGMTHVMLSFKQICKLDFFDGGYIEVSNNNGTTWTRLDGSHYRGTGQFINISNRFNGFSYIDWEPINPAAIPTNSWWKTEIFDITQLVSNSSQVMVRFIIKDMDFNGGAGQYGWLLDDITVKGGISELIPPQIIAAATNPSGSVPGTGPFQVSATITDSSGIASAKIIYTTGTITDSVMMSAGAGGLYTGYIPSAPFQTSICYQIKATDSSAYSNTMIYPATGCISFVNYKEPAIVQVGNGTTQGYAAPMFNGTIASTEKYSQHISIFTSGELGIKGMIESLQWQKSSLNGYTLGDAKLRIYLKHTTLTAVPTLAGSFASELQGATLVYEDTTESLALADGWQNYLFNVASFNYQGNTNLMVLVDWYRPGSLAANYVQWYYTSAAQKAITFYGSGANPTLTTGSGQRPNTIFLVDELYYNHDAAVHSLISPTGTFITAQPTPVLVNIRNAGELNLTKATINWSVDGILQTPYLWTGNLPTLVVSLNLNLGTYLFTNGSHTIKAWTSLPNDSADQNTSNDTLTESIFGCASILNGVYTVGTPTSDIATMADLFSSLYQCGISGPCTFRIMPGTYMGPFVIFDSIPGLSAVNTITFTSYANDPTSVIIKHGSPSAAANYVFNLDRVQHVTIDRLTIQTESTTAGNCITLTNSAARNTISNCILLMPYGENYDVNGIINSAGCHFNSIIGNTVTNGYRNIVASGTNSNPIKGLKIEHNTLTNGSRYAADISYNDSAQIRYNKVYSSYVAPSSSRYGLAINQSKQLTITHNQIHMHMAGYAYAIYYQYCNDAPQTPGLIANNFISMTGSSVQYGNHAINFSYSSNVRIYHNSFMVATGNSNASTLNFEGSCMNIQMKNNSIANLNGGLAMNGTSAAAGAFSASNYNNFFTTGATLAKWNSSTLVPVSGGIAALTAVTAKDSNSFITNPMYYSHTNLHSYSPVMNNAGTPLADVTIDIDGELRSTTTPDIGADEYAVSAIDAGAVSIHSPNATATQGTLLPVKVLIRNYGTTPLTSSLVAYSVNGGAPVTTTWTGSLNTGQTDTVTFLNFTVPALTYTLTAYTLLTGDTLTFNDSVTEARFGNPIIDASVTRISSPTGGCNPGTENVSITIRNFGQQGITTGLSAHYQLSGSSTIVSEVIGTSLNVNDSLNFTFSTPVNLQTSTDSVFILKAWVTQPLDPNPANDTSTAWVNAQALLPAPILTDTTISYGQHAVLTAISSNPVDWYPSPTSTNRLFSGLVYTTPPLFDTTTFYAEANTNIPSGQFIAGQGTNISQQYEWPNPFGKGFGGAKHQFLILSSELVNQGYVAGPIGAVSFFSSGALGQISGFELSIGTTTNNMASTSFFTGPFQNVFSGSVNITGGWFEIVFNTPFQWDGNSNLVLQTLTASGATLLNPPLLYDSTAFASTIYYIGTGAATATSGNVTVKRHNLRFSTIGTPGCNSIRVPVTVIVPPLQKDALVQDFAAPISGCNIGSTPVTIMVVNHGLDTIFGGIQASYKINSGTFTSPETISSTILPWDTLLHTFSSSASLPSGPFQQKYVITAAISLAGDLYSPNDTLVSDSITSLYTPSPLTLQALTIPYATSANLSPTSSDTIYWFNQATGGQPIFTGIPFTTPLLFDTTTYWVESRYTSPLNTYQIGTGTTYNNATAFPSPYGSSQFGAKHQFLIRASELAALGMQQGNIQSIGFNVAAPGTTLLQNYSIRIGHTAQTTMGSFETNLTSVFAVPTYAVTSGVNTHLLQIPFEWDGTSNLVIETCFKNYSNGSIAQVYNSNAGFTASLLGVGGGTFDCATTSSAQTYTSRPNVYLKVISYGKCASDRVPMQVNLSGIPAIDASVTGIISPVLQATSATATPVTIELKNYGTSVLTSTPIYYQVDNQTPSVYNWTGNLARLATATVTIGNVNFTGGIETLKVWVAKPGDNTQVNDTASETLTVCMQGVYTIGAGKRYTTISAAVSTLVQAGVCGHTIFEIDPGTYPEMIVIPTIPGSSANSTITFRSSTSDSSDVTIADLTNVNNRSIVSLVNASYINLKHLTITANGSAYGYAVAMDGNSHHINISNSVLTGATTTTSGNAAGVYSVSSSLHHITIEHNVINNGFHGVYLTGSSTGNQSKIKVNRNFITGFYQVGVYTYYQDSLEISFNNIISGASSQYYYGVRSYYLANDFSIHGNRMELYPTTYGYGIDISYSNGSVANYGRVFNNMISLLTGTGNHNGLASTTNSYIRYAFNSIFVAGSSTTKRAVQVGTGSNIQFLNNNLIAENNGYAFYTTVPGTITVMDYNNLYVGQPTSTFVHWGGAINSFAALQAFDPSKNANSISEDPVYKSATDLHADNILLNAKGTPIAGITTDFDGQLRHLTTPDIGADEFFPAPFDLSVLKIVKPFETSCGYTGNDSIIVRLRNAGENTWNFATNPVNIKVYISGSVQDTVLTIVNTGTINSATSSDITVHSNYNFGTKGHYIVYAEVITALDTVPGNNASTPFTFISLKEINTFPHVEDFEGGYNLSFNELIGSDADMNVVGIAANNSSKGLHFEGGGYSGFNSGATVDLAFANTTHITKAYTCDILPGSSTGLKMKFDLKQTYSATGNPNTSWFRVMLNNVHGTFYLKNTQGDSTFRAITPNTDPFTTQIFDLQQYTGQPFSISLEASCKVRHGEGTYSGDNAYVDNFLIWEPTQHDVAIQSLTAPVLSYNKAGNLQYISVLVANLGTQPITALPLNYQVGNGTPVNEVFQVTIAPYGFDTLTFTTPFITPSGNQLLSVYATLPGDGNLANDTLNRLFKGLNTYTVPFADDFEGAQEWVTGGTNQQWELGMPSTAIINSTHSGSNAWVTRADQNYLPTSVEILYSPFFVIPQTPDTATISFWQWLSVVPDQAYGIIQYSTNFGNSWNNLGYIGSNDGTNWYNAIVTGVHCWSSTQPGWTHSSHILYPSVFNTGMPFQFRFMFYTNSYVISKDGWAIDDFSITIPPPDYDAKAISIVAPQGGTPAGEQVTVSMQVMNNGVMPVSTMPLSYQINGNPPVTEVWNGTLLPGDTVTYTFTTTYTGPVSAYNLCAYAKLAADYYTMNDTVCQALMSTPGKRDAGVSAVITPTGQVGINSNIEVSVVLKNYGTDTLYSIPVTYSISSMLLGNETYNGTLLPGGTTNFTFLMKYNSPAGNYDVCAETKLAGDINPANNTTCESIVATGLAEHDLYGMIIGQNIPNPANQHTVIPVEVTTSGTAVLTIRSLTGKVIHNQEYELSSGKHQLHILTNQLAEGVYLYTIEFNGYQLTRKMLIIR
jgi:hypothetical protein